jgi:general secretion pathway protein D
LAITPRILRAANRPDLAQAELWVGTELATRLHSAPGQKLTEADNSAAPSTDTSVVPPKPALPSGPVRASWQGPPEVKVGDVFTVTLNLASGQPLRGAPLEITYPAQALEVLEVSEGAFFKQDEGVTSFTQTINTQTGRVGVGVLRNDATGAQGQATMLTMQLKAKTAGPLELKLTTLKPIALEGTVPLAELPVLALIAK